MEILPVVKLIEQDLDPLAEGTCGEEENDSESESGEIQVQEVEDKSTVDVLPEVKKGKPTLHEEDIFALEEKPKKETKTRKPRKPMTEAQKENLKKAREKALAVRRAKAEEKKEIKVLKEKKKKKEIQQLRDEVEDTPKKAVSTMPLPTTLQSLDPELIRKLQHDAIEGYDKLRKERKAKKKQEQETHNRNTNNMNRINNALNPPKSVKYGDAGFFSHLF
jgi:hypothetical protein